MAIEHQGRPAASDHPSSPAPVPPMVWPPEPDVALSSVAALQKHLATDGPDVETRPTAFHCRYAPPFTLVEYASRVACFSGYGGEGIAYGLALLARYTKATGRAPTALTAHRLLAACIVVGMKANSDAYVQNQYMAHVTGLPLNELNWLESRLLDALTFSAMPTSHEMASVFNRLSALASQSSNSSDTLLRALTDQLG